MAPNLEARLRLVYPAGRLNDPDRDALLGGEYIGQVRAAVEAVCAAHAMQCGLALFSVKDRAHGFAITEGDGPSQADWCGLAQRYDNPAKLDWIQQHGRPFPILWLKFSRVFPAYDLYYNLWVPRGDSGYLDREITHCPPTQPWAPLHPALHADLHANDLTCLDIASLREQVPFVVDDYYEDEQGNDLPNDIPPRVLPVCVGEAVFPMLG